MAKQRRPGVNFNAHGFRNSHSCMPRGVAVWIFYFADAPDDAWIARRHDKQIRPMAYLAAKDYATAEAIRRGVTSVRVDPQPLL